MTGGVETLREVQRTASGAHVRTWASGGQCRAVSRVGSGTISAARTQPARANPRRRRALR
jgi:hypothetical protein